MWRHLIYKLYFSSSMRRDFYSHLLMWPSMRNSLRHSMYNLMLASMIAHMKRAIFQISHWFLIWIFWSSDIQHFRESASAVEVLLMNFFLSYPITVIYEDHSFSSHIHQLVAEQSTNLTCMEVFDLTKKIEKWLYLSF